MLRDAIVQYRNYGMWRSLVAHFVRDEGAAGSNPVIPIFCASGRFCTGIEVGAQKFGL